MIIKRMVLHNFGVYANTNTFEFSGEKPVVLIGGLNGRGKTTILDAVLLALYGSNSFAYIESKFKSYGQYLRAFVNKTDGTLYSYVDLEFQLDSRDTENYLVHREWSATGQRTYEKIKVYRDGEENAFLADNWSMFIENVLPSGLSNFFFFDGEKIAELADEKTNTQMKESIKTLLGISVLDMLENDIRKIMSKSGNGNGDKFDIKKFEKLKQKKDHTAAILADTDAQIAELEIQLVNLEKKIEAAHDEYTTKGGDIIAQRQELFTKRNRLETQKEHSKENLLERAASELPLNLVKPMLVNIQKQVEQEHENKISQLTVQKLQATFKTYAKEQTDSSEAVQSFLDYVVCQSDRGDEKPIFGMSDTSLYLLKTLVENQLDMTVKDTEKQIETLDDVQSKLDEIESYLSVDIDEKALARTYKRIRTLEQQKIDTEVELESRLKKRSTFNGEAISANSEFNRFVESMISEMELHDDSERVLKYTHMVINILDAYKIRLQARKAETVADTMTKCYKKLANKKNLIDHIVMDAKTLDLTYLNKDSQEVPKESLSAGEKQLMVIALLWSLAMCSRKKLPVIIDTPLSRLDSAHRMSLMTNYFPYASEQIIILSTDSEIDRNYYEILKENISDEFTLMYDDATRRTTIHRGYFMEDTQ